MYRAMFENDALGLSVLSFTIPILLGAVFLLSRWRNSMMGFYLALVAAPFFSGVFVALEVIALVSGLHAWSRHGPHASVWVSIAALSFTLAGFLWYCRPPRMNSSDSDNLTEGDKPLTPLITPTD